MRIATRGSALARWQADYVTALLAEAQQPCEATSVIISTHGDRRTDLPLAEIGGKGVFVKEVQAALLDGRADIAVHSAKDLPALTPAELRIAAVPERGDPTDVLVGARLDDLAPGSMVATGSARRQAQLAHHRPDLEFVGLRGNIETRLSKAVNGVSVVAAGAALVRLGLAPDVVDRLDHTVMLPQVGQGTLAVECRADDHETIEMLAQINHGRSMRILDAERAFLAGIGGDCSLPVAAHAVLLNDESPVAGDGGTDGDGASSGVEIRIEALIASIDGRSLVRDFRTGSDGVAMGRELAAALLDEFGGVDRLLGQI